MYDVNKIREDFPILSRTVYGKPLVYLDNGATTQKPRCVVDAMVEEYYSVNANVHRGYISCRSRLPICTKLRGKRYVASSMPAAPMRLSLPGALRRASIW